MNCREALENLYDYLDGQLDETSAKKIKDHLEICDHCFDTYEFEKLLQNFVVDKGQLSVRTEPLKTKVMEKIKELDSEEEGAPGFFSVVRPYLAAAAAIVVTMVGLYFYLNQSSSTLYASFIDCHLRCDNPVSTTTEVTAIPAARIDSCLSHIAVFPAEFMKGDDRRIPTIGEVNQYEGEDAAHFVFDYDGSLISVFVMDEKNIRPGQYMKQTSDERHTYYQTRENDFNIVMWQCAGAWCVAVSRADYDTIVDFASAY